MTNNLTDDNFHDTLDNSEGVSVVQFTASWCVPCRILTPRLSKLADDLGVDYYKVDVDANGGLVREFGIKSVPTVQYYKDGKLVKSEVGGQDYQHLASNIESL